jgi:hypothetical protein
VLVSSIAVCTSATLLIPVVAEVRPSEVVDAFMLVKSIEIRCVEDPKYPT